MEKTVIYLLEDGYVDFVVEKIHKKMKKLLEEKEKIFAVLAGGRTPFPFMRNWQNRNSHGIVSTSFER